ncbi:Sec-independent protein translocase subunit TatA/TatB [Cerasicoccus fimbriatus]|uniref:Sec-independent protein translocase subunit TatA/TatB n=1 Tax=Cerasicoccus fimbriatus TaxID=3014554 RepID=UPI0022B59013|nr:twin-arginine translocase TatA/TatE family subunit [Cerasicoccus sp. TK19100]
MNMFLNSLPVAFLSNLQGWEIPLLVIFGLIIFGGKKLPEFARGAGQAIKEFKKASKSAEDTFKQALNEEDEAKPKPVANQPAQTKGEEAAKI